jgi:phospholipid N-methyltransferase
MILNKKSDSANFFAVELNEHLTEVLKEKLPQLKIYNDSATELPKLLKKENMAQADIIISGLPWASFPKSLQSDILNAILDALAPDGYFVTFAYLQGVLLPAGKNFKKLLHKSFKTVEKSPTIWRNSPPAFVYRCKR